MSHLKYFSYEPKGAYNARTFGYTQSVKVDNVVYISGQGGWTNTVPAEYAENQPEQIDQAFKNIKLALAEAGATFENVFKVVSYHVPLDPTSLGRVVERFAEYMPNHKPLWTCVEVPAFGEKEMLVEIEVVAHLPTV